LTASVSSDPSPNPLIRNRYLRWAPDCRTAEISIRCLRLTPNRRCLIRDKSVLETCIGLLAAIETRVSV
jgi:hypothetical protein